MPLPPVLQLYQIALNGLQNAVVQVAAAFPALAGSLAAAAPAPSPTAAATLQLLQTMQSHNLAQTQQLSAPSNVSAATAALAVAAAGRPTAAPQAAPAPLPSSLSPAAGPLAGGGGGAVAAAVVPRGGEAGGSAPAAAVAVAAPDSTAAAAGRRDQSMDPGASDGSQEPQRKRVRREDGAHPAGRPAPAPAYGSGKVCRAAAGQGAAVGQSGGCCMVPACSPPTFHPDPSHTHTHMQPCADAPPPLHLPAPHPQVCSNCHTSNTPFWRKNRHTGLPLCNACG